MTYLVGSAAISITGRTATVPLRAAGIRPAMAIASFKIFGLDHKVAAELLARLGKRPVGHQPFAIPNPDAGRRGDRLQRRGAHILPAGM